MIGVGIVTTRWSVVSPVCYILPSRCCKAIAVSTTTLRIDEELRERIGQIAHANGVSAHAFMLGAIERSVEDAERRQSFEATAEARWQRFLADGETLSWEETKAWLRSRAQVPR